MSITRIIFSCSFKKLLYPELCLAFSLSFYNMNILSNYLGNLLENDFKAMEMFMASLFRFLCIQRDLREDIGKRKISDSNYRVILLFFTE